MPKPTRRFDPDAYLSEIGVRVLTSPAENPGSKNKVRFDPNQVDALVVSAKAGDLVARNELLFRFQRLVASLVGLCLSGRPNSWSPSHRKFLQMFGAKSTDPLAIAAMLKKELAGFDKEELFHTGQLAVLKAIDRSTKNLAATVVICFKDEIHGMIKGARSTAVDFLESELVLETDGLERSLAFDLFLMTLSDEEYAYADHCMEHGSAPEGEAPAGLVQKLAMYAERDIEEEDEDDD